MRVLRSERTCSATASLNGSICNLGLLVDINRWRMEWDTWPVFGAAIWPVSFSEFSRPRNLSPKGAPEFPEKGTNIRCQCLRLFHRCEVSPAREFGPVLDVVATLDPRPRRKWRLPWKVRDAARYFDPLARCQMKRGRPHFEVQTAGRVNRFGHPIKRNIRQQLVPREPFFKVAVAVGPVFEFFKDPGGQRSGRVVQPVGNGLRRAKLNVVVCPKFFSHRSASARNSCSSPLRTAPG